MYLLAYYFVEIEVRILRSPLGEQVGDNTYDYPILSRITLLCAVLSDSDTVTNYQWNTTGCYTNPAHNSGNPTCFSTEESGFPGVVTSFGLTATDAGTITCTVTINNRNYTSEPLTLRISGIVHFDNLILYCHVIYIYIYIYMYVYIHLNLRPCIYQSMIACGF